MPREVAFGLQLQFGQSFLVPEPQVFRPFEQRVGAAFRLPDLVDGLVGVPGHVELVDDPPRMGQMRRGCPFGNPGSCRMSVHKRFYCM